MDDLVVPHFRTGLVSQRNSTALGSRMLVGFWREKVMECWMQMLRACWMMASSDTLWFWLGWPVMERARLETHCVEHPLSRCQQASNPKRRNWPMQTTSVERPFGGWLTPLACRTPTWRRKRFWIAFRLSLKQLQKGSTSSCLWCAGVASNRSMMKPWLLLLWIVASRPCAIQCWSLLIAILMKRPFNGKFWTLLPHLHWDIGWRELVEALLESTTQMDQQHACTSKVLLHDWWLATRECGIATKHWQMRARNWRPPRKLKAKPLQLPWPSGAVEAAQSLSNVRKVWLPDLQSTWKGDFSQLHVASCWDWNHRPQLGCNHVPRKEKWRHFLTLLKFMPWFWTANTFAA